MKKTRAYTFIGVALVVGFAAGWFDAKYPPGRVPTWVPMRNNPLNPVKNTSNCCGFAGKPRAFATVPAIWKLCSREKTASGRPRLPPKNQPLRALWRHSGWQTPIA